MADLQPREKLTIDNFCGIEHIEIEMYPINVLIGPQAGGKSIIAKLFYFFKSLPQEMITSIVDEKSFDDFRQKYIKKFKNYFDPSGCITDGFTIQYFNGKNDFAIHQGNTKLILELDFSPQIIDFYKRCEQEWNVTKHDDIVNDSWSKALAPLKKYIDIEKLVRGFFRQDSGIRQVFIPAGRSLFSVLQNNIFGLLSNDIEIDSFLLEFGFVYERARKYLVNGEMEEIVNTEFFNEFNSKILKAGYQFEEDHDYLKHLDGRFTKITNTSSGQQEALPLSIVLNSIINNPNYDLGTTVYIEEPEAHLFPSSQKKVVELLSYIFDQKENIQLFITTHSPYILTSFNNLLQAGVTEQEIAPEKQGDLYKIVPKEQIIKPGVLQALAIDNGTSKDIMDHEDGLIDGSAIDDVSEEIGEQFEQLINL